MTAPSLFWSVPFALLLLSIALFPLVAPAWWAKRYPWVALPLGAIVAAYYMTQGETGRMLVTGHDYLSFIALIGSLFVVAGGINLGFRGEFTPKQNVALLGVGAVLSNIVGTTGAAMILIRPFIRANAWRRCPFHAVFFIFIVANCGGALTPVGDPPLFLGYIKGVPFLWVLDAVWYAWLIAIGLLLAVFYVLDARNYRSQPHRERVKAEQPDRMRVEGLHNLLFLAVILGAAFVQRPLFVRESLMIAAAAGSFLTTPERIHRLNEFKFHPIVEVAILFAGIFATMVPALDWVSANAGSLGLRDAAHFYWATGAFSSVLDNAPTYLNFLAAAMGLNGLSPDHTAGVAEFARTAPHVLRAISVGAVFFGAATYIGNGPNFMVKSIAEHQGLHAPTFVEYIYKYTLPFLLPVLVITYFLVR